MFNAVYDIQKLYILSNRFDIKSFKSNLKSSQITLPKTSNLDYVTNDSFHHNNS